MRTVSKVCRITMEISAALRSPFIFFLGSEEEKLAIEYSQVMIALSCSAYHREIQ